MSAKNSNDYSLNVFTYGYYSWRCPFKNIKTFFRNLRRAWQRATKGYCDFDIYDLDTYHTNMMIKALYEFTDKIQSYPADMSYEDWVRTICEIANCFEESVADDDFDDPEREEWDKLAKPYEVRTENEDGSVTVSVPDNIPELNAAREKWLAVLKADQHYRTDMKNRAFDLLKQYYWHLWW